MKEWWKKIFIPVIGEVMFSPREKQAVLEVNQIFNQVKVSKGARILDLACGTGRHSIPMAKNKMTVTGLDFTKNFIVEARKKAKSEKVDVKFIQGDMKNLKPHFDSSEFDLVVSLFNSFGYFKVRSDDRKMLKEVFRVLRPGGRLVINTLNGNGVEKVLKRPVSNGREPIRNVFMIDAARYDSKKKKTFAQWTIVDARKNKTKISRLKFDQNVYSHGEMRNLLQDTGFKIEKTWGLLHGESFDPKTSWHQTIVARKPI